MNRPKKILLLSLLLAGMGLALVPPLTAWIAVFREPPCSRNVTVFAGVYPSGSACGRRASLLRLSEEIRRWPHGDTFRVRRNENWYWCDDTDKDETFYDRRQHVLYEGNVWAGDVYRWGHVTDQEIKAVAHSSGEFREFGRYGYDDMNP